VLFLLIVFLHVATMFTAVALAYGGVLFFLIALRSGNVPGLISMATGSKAVERVIPVLFLAGAVFGLLAAINGGFNLLAPWLIIAYALFIALTVIGARFTGPSIKKMGELVAATPDGPLSPEAVALRQRFYRTEVLDFLLLFLIIFDMVVKPFS
jgi:hypothetical protein